MNAAPHPDIPANPGCAAAPDNSVAGNGAVPGGAGRRAGLLLCAAAGAAFAFGAAAEFPPLIVWNASASAPVGFYRILGGEPRQGDLVLARLPTEAARLAAERGWLPEHVPVLKRVRGLPGDRVCWRGRDVLVNGEPVARARRTDGQGRPLPRRRGCVALGHGRLFLLNAHPASLDGRYFGATARSDVLGRAVPFGPPGFSRWFRSLQSRHDRPSRLAATAREISLEISTITKVLKALRA